MNDQIRIFLDSVVFAEKKKRLVQHDDMSVDCFRYASGVEALEVRNRKGGYTLLPYHGQQIWRCDFFDRELTMKSMFDEPTGSRDYLQNYGGFLLHCGATAMGVPSPEDTHPLHGDLPNALYQSGEVRAGDRDGVPCISVSGSYEHRVAFNYHYRARPVVTLTADASVIDVQMEITNLRHEPMPLMYMMHINHRPEDNAQLKYSAYKNAESVRIHNSVPGHMKSERIEELKSFMNRLESEPELHHVLTPDLPLDPEVVFSVDYQSDTEGWAHTLLEFTDGHASYVSHRPDELPVGIRWLARKADEEAAGIILPATAEHGGYTAELEKGNVQYLQGGESRTFNVRTGLLPPDETKAMIGRIDAVLG